MRQHLVRFSLVALAFPLLLAVNSACAEPAKPAAAPVKEAPAAEPAKAAPAGATPAWKDMTPEQKGKVMKTQVTPKMKAAFQKFDPEHFKVFNCSTCHGKDAKEKKFKMPNPEITPLPSTPEAFQAMMKKKPEWAKWTKFMKEEVVTGMVATLGVPEFDFHKPDPTAFGCKNCHTLEKADKK
jgi:cytochrome c553